MQPRDSVNVQESGQPESQEMPDLGQTASRPNDPLASSARRIQDAWRRHVSRPRVGHSELATNNPLSSMGPNDRWQDALTHAETRKGVQAAKEGENDSQARWRRTVHFVSRLQQTGSIGSGTVSSPDLDTKVLETQHWLELIDGKHRYGSNLKYYHRKWLASDTQDNFFKWLDRGGGKDLSLEQCPRERLEQERIIYLSSEQRRNYLVRIDEKGLLRWVRNDDLVDTSPGLWTDAGDGKGVVPYDSIPEDEQSVARRTSFESDGRKQAVATHYASAQQKSSNKFTKTLREHFTAGGINERLLRKTTKKNTWIYVADKNLNLYLGLKDTGTFQHSSFLGGGLVVSAGLLKVQQGLITKLSPLSGHYRTKIDSFMNFVDRLEAQGADLHKVQISKAEVALWGLERWKKFQKRKSTLTEKAKSGIADAVETIKDNTPEPPFTSHHGGNNWKLEVLHGRKKKESHNDNV